MKNNKEKGIDLILLGMAISWIPAAILGRLVDLDKLSPPFGALVPLFSLGLFIIGLLFFIKGCRLYVQSKGYASAWGWLGLFSIFSLPILVLLPSRKKAISLLERDETDSRNPFEKIYVTELFLYLLSLVLLLAFILLILSYQTSLKIENFIDYNIVLDCLAEVLFLFYLFRIFRLCNLNLGQTIGNKNQVELKLISFILLIKYSFAKGLNSIILYNLSFVFPTYVENYINEKPFNNILEIIIWGISANLLTPLMEELFFRGIILQKWSLKWGVTRGIIASSFLFAIIHFRFDIISLFITGILLSILYFKTRNLINSILLHCFYNTLITIFNIINYFSQSPIERNKVFSVQEYQDWIQPLLSQRVLLIALSLPVLIYFIYKNFPKNDAVIPYYANEDNPIDL